MLFESCFCDLVFQKFQTSLACRTERKFNLVQIFPKTLLSEVLKKIVKQISTTRIYDISSLNYKENASTKSLLRACHKKKSLYIVSQAGQSSDCFPLYLLDQVYQNSHEETIYLTV